MPRKKQSKSPKKTSPEVLTCEDAQVGEESVSTATDMQTKLSKDLAKAKELKKQKEELMNIFLKVRKR